MERCNGECSQGCEIYSKMNKKVSKLVENARSRIIDVIGNSIVLSKLFGNSTTEIIEQCNFMISGILISTDEELNNFFGRSNISEVEPFEGNITGTNYNTKVFQHYIKMKTGKDIRIGDFKYFEL